MGQTYWVVLKTKVTDKGKATEALQNYLERFSWLKKKPVDFKGCIKEMLAEHQGGFDEKEEDGFTI